VAQPTPSRVAALETLRAVRGGALADRALEQAAAALPVRERAWTQELVYGTLRLRGRLDHRLAALASRGLHRMDPDILDVLRLGAYQLTEMGGVPAYAAVSQSVDLAKRSGGRRASGFVNGVLQSLRREGNASTFPDFETDAAAHLVTWGSHPEWLVQRWIERFGADAALRLVDANNRRPELYLRALGDVGQATGMLEAAGVGVEAVPGAPQALRLLEGSVTTALAAAPVIVQDPAAGLVVTFADAPAGARIVDLAAAPGGKALALAAPAQGARVVVAADVSARRLALLRQNLDRFRRTRDGATGITLVAPVVADGRQPPFRPVDMVLLDAPCTGTGTLRRHPDGRWRVGPADLEALVQLQRSLLDAAAALVEPGGLLVYSTCSLEREENEDQVEWFLERHGEFGVEPGPAPDSMLRAGALVVLPQEHGFDGAFAVRLRRSRAG
jgi:16S rRNA (cytosine967-C5)-methyltransferase